MRESADKMWAQIKEWFAAMPRGRKIQLAILSVVVVALAIFVVSMLTRTNWVRVPIADQATAPQVYAALQEMGIPTNVRGNIIEVPEERLGDAQMRLREQGLLGVSDFDLGIMSEASGFGVTDNHARRLYDAQTAENIRTQLLQSPRIQNALVIVNSGETSPFRIQTNARQATATVMLTLIGGERLSRGEVTAIGEIIRGAVPGIEYNNISITDNELNFYSLGEVGDDLEELIGQRNALKNRLIEQLQRQVMEMLAPVYGAQNVQVQPHVKLNFDVIVTERVEFEPPVAGELEGIVRSMEEIYEHSRRWGDAEGIPGTDSNNMGTVEYPWGPLNEDDYYRRSVLSRNYEINETRVRIEHEQGDIEELSIAVLINSEIEGVEQEYTEEVTDLVARAIGVAPALISVQHIPFAFIDTTLADMYAEWEAQETAMRNRALLETILMYVVIVLLGVMVMLLVRTIFKAVKPPPEPEPVLVAAGPEGIDLLADEDISEDMEYDDVDLTTKSPGLEQIERFIDKDSASVAQLLRNWLSDE